MLTCLLPRKSGAPKQVILVEMGQSAAPTLRGHAQMLVETDQGQLVGGPRQLDSKAALVLKLPGAERGMNKAWAQQRVILSVQGKETFTIRLFADAGENIEATLADVFAGWRFQPFAPPFLHLQVAPWPTSFSRGRLIVNLPEMMSPVPPEVAGKAGEMVAVDDAREGVAALTLSVATIPSPMPLTLSVMRRNFGAVLKQRLHLSHDLAWHEATGVPPRALSSFFAVPAALIEPGYAASSAYGLVKMGDNEWAILTFTITGQKAPAKALYAAAVEKMFASVRMGGVKVDAPKLGVPAPKAPVPKH